MLWVIVDWIGVAFYRANLFTPAAFIFRQSVAARPNDHFARWYLAWTLHRQARFDEAIGEFQELLTRWRDDPDLYVGLGEALQERNRHTEAIEAFSNVLAVRPDDVKARFNLAVSYAAVSEYEQAIAAYGVILSKDPSHADALCNLGTALGACGRWKESAEYCRRAVELEPLPVHIYNLGVALAELGDLAEAEEAFRRALELQPGTRDYLVRLAMVLSQRGRLDEAVALFAQSTMSATENGEGLAHLVSFLLHRERLTDALQTAQLAAQRYPDVPATQTALGWALLENGQVSEALARLERALTLDAAYVDALAARAVTRRLLGEHRRALGDFSRVADLDPEYFARHPWAETQRIESKAIVDEQG